MKTTRQQFDLLVTFMEEHGDLSKPVATARARRLVMEHWENLTILLNSDRSGDTKTTEKWKKVWSDFKNNLKKKAARLHRATVIRGGPAVYAKLSDLEQRVLQLTGIQTSTGLSVRKDLTIESIETVDQKPQINHIDESVQLSNDPDPSCHGVQRSHAYSEPSTSGPVVFQIIVNSQEETTNIQSIRDSINPTVQESDVAAPQNLVQPSSRGHTIPRITMALHNQQKRRRLGPRKKLDRAARNFQRSDDEWREFRMQQHGDLMGMKREKNRIRKLELGMQREWRSIAVRTLDLVERVVNKFCEG